MSWIRDTADRAAGALQGAWTPPAEPHISRSKGAARQPAVSRPPTSAGSSSGQPGNAYERAAFQSLPRQLEAELRAWDRTVAEQWAQGRRS